MAVPHVYLQERQVNIEAGSFTRFSRGGDDAIVVFNDLFYNGQTYTGAFVFFFSMQALEHFKDAVAVLIIKANAVIGYSQVVIRFF